MIDSVLNPINENLRGANSLDETLREIENLNSDFDGTEEKQEEDLGFSANLQNKIKEMSLPESVETFLDTNLEKLKLYSKNSLGNQINNMEIPQWGKNFLLTMAHLSPVLLTVSSLKSIPIPHQIKSSLGLALMYLGVWGDKNIEELPKVAAMSSVSSFASDALKMPSAVRRTLQIIAIKTAQELKEKNMNTAKEVKSLEYLGNFAKDLVPSLIKIHTTLPLVNFFAGKINNPILKPALELLGISSGITILSSVLNKFGMKSNNLTDSLNVADGCPLCGGETMFQCISSEAAPIASLNDELHRNVLT